jgi:hypothetical protein
MTKSNKRPTHVIWQVIDYEEKSRWIRVGAAWPNKDGKGLALVFDSYPVIGRIQVREISEQQPDGNGGQ